jgi:peroxiredoxin
MPRVFLIIVLATLVSFLGTASAGLYNKVLDIGDPAPAWAELPGVDGKAHSLSDHKDKDLVVVVFTCNSCPIAEGYEDRIIAFDKKYCGPNGNAALVAICVNTIPEDRLPALRARAKEKGFRFQYLHDPTQKIAKDYGAIYTPEFFVLDKNRKIAYMGAMDDRNTEADAKQNYLEPAVAAALKGEKATMTETRGRGCLIRYLRPRD